MNIFQKLNLKNTVHYNQSHAISLNGNVNCYYSPIYKLSFKFDMQKKSVDVVINENMLYASLFFKGEEFENLKIDSFYVSEDIIDVNDKYHYCFEPIFTFEQNKKTFPCFSVIVPFNNKDECFEDDKERKMSKFPYNINIDEIFEDIVKIIQSSQNDN